MSTRRGEKHVIGHLLMKRRKCKTICTISDDKENKLPSSENQQFKVKSSNEHEEMKTALKMGKKTMQDTVLASWRKVSNITVDYQIDGKLASTIQGAVYKGRHRKSGTPVALKAVSKKAYEQSRTLSGLTVAEDIAKEMTILSELKGLDGIVQLFDAVEDSICFFLVTKFEERGDLFDYLANSPAMLSEAKVRKIFKSIVEAVASLHERGICHLDLSLENVFISKEYELKLGDFGVARKVDEKKQDGDVRIGKPKYMSPEMVAGLCFDGLKADMYSLGVVLYCLLYSCHPYDEPSEDDTGYTLIHNGCLLELLEQRGFKGTRTLEAEHMLNALLCPAADERLSIQAVQSHSWLN